MESILTPSVIEAVLALLTVIITGAFAWVRSKKIIAEDQGDILLDSAKTMLVMAQAFAGADAKRAEAIQEIEALVAIIEDCWNDSKAGTPEMDAYFEELKGLVEALLK